MMVQSRPTISHQLDKITNHVQKLQEKHQEKKPILDSEIKKILADLQSCGDSLKQRAFAPDKQMDKSVARLLAALAFFQSIAEKDPDMQKRVGAFQTILLATFKREGGKEENLKDKKWRLGQRVQKIDEMMGS